MGAWRHWWPSCDFKDEQKRIPWRFCKLCNWYEEKK